MNTPRLTCAQIEKLESMLMMESMGHGAITWNWNIHGQSEQSYRRLAELGFVRNIGDGYEITSDGRAFIERKREPDEPSHPWMIR